MISLNSVSPARLYSSATEKFAPHRLTILFGLAVLGAASAVYYVYRRLNPSLHELGRQAFEQGDYRQAAQYFCQELNVTKAPYILPYYWRNAADLKLGDFCRVKDSCEKALGVGKPVDQLKAQFVLQEMEAHLGLDEPRKAMQTFEKNKDLLTQQSKLLGEAYYLLGLAYKGTWDASDVVKCCDKALEQIQKLDLKLKVKVLVLKSLALLDLKEYPKAAEIGYSALRLFHPNTGKVSKETLVVLYFSLALSEYAQQKYRLGDSDFEKALGNIEKDDQYLRNLLTFQSRYFRAVFAKSCTDAQTTLREFEEAYKACDGKSDDRRCRSELTRCIIRILVMGCLSQGNTLLSQLADRIEILRKINSST